MAVRIPKIETGSTERRMDHAFHDNLPGLKFLLPHGQCLLGYSEGEMHASSGIMRRDDPAWYRRFLVGGTGLEQEKHLSAADTEGTHPRVRQQRLPSEEGTVKLFRPI